RTLGDEIAPGCDPGHRGPAHEAQDHGPGPVPERDVGADPRPLVGDDRLDLPGHQCPSPGHQRRDGGGATAHVLSLARASFSCSTFTKGEPRKPSGMPCVCWLIRPRRRDGEIPVACETIGISAYASCGVISGSRPLPDVVTRSGVGLTPRLRQYAT